MIDESGCAPGVVLNPGTSVSSVEHVLDQCQVAVVMLVGILWMTMVCIEFMTVSDVFLLIIGKSWVWWTKIYQAGSRENQGTSRYEAPFVH